MASDFLGATESPVLPTVHLYGFVRQVAQATLRTSAHRPRCSMWTQAGVPVMFPLLGGRCSSFGLEIPPSSICSPAHGGAPFRGKEDVPR